MERHIRIFDVFRFGSTAVSCNTSAAGTAATAAVLLPARCLNPNGANLQPSMIAERSLTFTTVQIIVTVAARRERERVTAALILWKLHTQGKAFAALAAHCIRR